MTAADNVAAQLADNGFRFDRRDWHTGSTYFDVRLNHGLTHTVRVSDHKPSKRRPPVFFNIDEGREVAPLVVTMMKKLRKAEKERGAREARKQAFMDTLITPSDHQMEAVDAAVKDMEEKGLGVINGPGGVGKTALIAWLMNTRWRNRQRLMLGPTWMSVKVATKKASIPGKSVHSGLGFGRTWVDEEGQLRFGDETCKNLPRGGIVWIDEMSMLDTWLGGKLLTQLNRAGCKAIGTLDKFQLPPIKNKPLITDSHISFNLTEIHRQAQGIGTDTLGALRSGQCKTYWDVAKYLKENSDQSRKAQTEMKAIGKVDNRKLQYFFDAFCNDGQGKVVCFTNAKRRAINTKARLHYNFYQQGPLVEGEQVVSLSNTNGLVNGDDLIVEGFEPYQGHDFGELQRLNPVDMALHRVRFIDGREAVISMAALKNGWTETMKGLQKNINSLGESTKRRLSKLLRQIVMVDYSYAVTAHKAQGSQYPNVMYVWENVRDPRHPYTGMSRYQKRCFIAKG